MKYFEYVYLIAALMVFVFLIAEYGTLGNQTKYALLAALLIFSFMYSFRRSQRIKMDAIFKKEMEKLEQDEQGETDK